MSNAIMQDDESWQQALPRVQDALDFLQTTAEGLATSRTIDDGKRAEAVAIARRLAAELTAFGFAQAAEQAGNVVGTLDHAGLPQPERLQQQVGALRDSLTSALDK